LRLVGSLENRVPLVVDKTDDTDIVDDIGPPIILDK
jgi:hypothetical protein